jgi:hypothetical protein
LAPPEHRFGAVQPQRLDPDLDLALSGWGHLDLFNPEDFRATGLVKSHDTRHVTLLPELYGKGNTGDGSHPRLSRTTTAGVVPSPALGA